MKTNQPTITTTSLEGTFIDVAKKWKLGAQLGSGACGTVYALHRHRSSPTNSKDSSKDSSFVVKIASLPSSLTSTSKKRKKTAQEKNADLLFHEHILYSNVLNTLRGTMVPDIPLPGYSSSVPPSFGEFSSMGSSNQHHHQQQQKYRYLIMERMEHSFTSYLIPLILQNKILVSHVFVRLIRLIQSIHDLNYVYIDVKPENFMIASSNAANHTKSSSRNSSNSNSSTLLAQQIRIIDVALMESTKDIMRNGKHRVDAYPDGQMVGTPTYASRNVMMGHTPSRRDDLEAIAYVMLEVMLQVGMMASSQKTILQAEDENLLDVLPWSHGNSDEDVLQKKRNAVEEKDHGAFWNTVEEQVGIVARNCMKEYLDIVSNLEYKDKPDYEALVKLVNGIQLQLSSSNSSKRKTAAIDGMMKEAKMAIQKKKKNAATATNQRRVEEKKTPSIDTVHSPRAVRAATRNARKEKNQNVIVLDDGDKDNNDDYYDPTMDSSNDVDMKQPSSTKEDEVESSVEDMDWEQTTNTKKPKPFITIECISGPHKGESCILESSMIVGSHPKLSSSSNTIFPLSKDSHASANHTKLILSCSGGMKKGVLMVKVTDLKSSSGTFLNGKELPKGGSRQAFVNDCIKVGNSELRIKKS